MDQIFKQFSDLEKSILKTIAFFDVFDYPLTPFEIYKWLYQPTRPYSLTAVSQALSDGPLSEFLTLEEGFYFFKNRSEIIETRKERYQLAEKKFKIAKKVAAVLRCLSFVRLIAVCNSGGYNNTAAQSDIDFFIIVKAGRIWLTRFWVTVLASLLGRRRHGRKITNRICLSFYLADDHLDLSDIAFMPEDPYLVYWLATLAPVYDDGCYEELLIRNVWLKSKLPNFTGTYLSERRAIKNNFLVEWLKKQFNKILLGSFGSWLEKFLKLLQLKKMKANHQSLANQPDTRVVINDQMLKFHEADRRKQYHDLWQQKIKRIIG